MPAPLPSSPTPHGPFFTIDTHIDTPTASLRRPGWDLGARHDYAADGTQCDLPRMAEGGIDALVFAVYVGQMGRSPSALRRAHELALAHFERTHAALAANAAACGLARTADEALQLKAQGKKAFFLSIENAYSLGRDVANVAKFHALGVRMLGLTHMLNNDAADSSTDPRGAEWGGLSPLGREFVAEANRLGMILDASHASDAVLRDLLEISRTPVILSHSGCTAVCNHPRNIGDDLLRALAKQGGVIQINALAIAVTELPGSGRTAGIAEILLKYQDSELTPETMAEEDKDYDRVCAAHPNPRATLEHFVQHIEHAVAVAGIDHVGIGCDFDGGGGVEGLRDVTDYPQVTAALRQRGWGDDALAKLWGGNTLRLYRAAEAAARKV